MSLFIRTDAAALGSTSCREEEGEARGMRSAATPSDATILLKPTDLQLFICLKIKIGVCAFGASRLSRGYVFRFTCVTADVRRSSLLLHLTNTADCLSSRVYVIIITRNMLLRYMFTRLRPAWCEREVKGSVVVVFFSYV